MPLVMSNTLASNDKRTFFEIFAAEFQQVLDDVVKSGEAVSLVLFDIDWFGKANEEHGRAVGDAVIETFAASLLESVDGRGRVMRYGGDAHMAILCGTPKEDAFLLAEEARKRFEGPHVVRVDGRTVELSLTLSAGVASYPDDDAKAPELMRKVNEALYRAKVSGRNKVCLAREEKMQTKTSHYTQGQLAGLARLAKREGIGEAVILREALTDVLRKYNS